MNTNTSSSPGPDDAIAQLKRDWPQLSDVDRALAVAKIKASSGMSNRQIAKGVQHSENSIRRLLLALQATAADLAAARNNQISTSELIRRAKTEASRRKKKQLETQRRKHERQVVEGSKAISDWLEQEHLGGSRGEAIALEARDMLIADYRAKRLPPADPHVVHPAAEWIERCRPQAPLPDDPGYISWYALWLARWSFCFCRDPELAMDALALAGRL